MATGGTFVEGHLEKGQQFRRELFGIYSLWEFPELSGYPEILRVIVQPSNFSGL